MSTAWLAAAVATHLVVGVAAAHLAVAADRWWSSERATTAASSTPAADWRGVAVAGLVGGGLPDVDLAFSFGWPLVHRGLLHTPLFCAVVVAGVVRVRGRRPALAVGAGYCSHLLLDSLTPAGIAWLFPWPVRYGLALPAHSYPADAALVVASAAVVVAVRRLDPP